MPGFQFTETMSGTYTHEGHERPLTFQATARADSLWRFLGDKVATLEGVVDADGLASSSHMSGTIVISPLLKRIIRYEFDFTGSDGKTYRFAGQKDIVAMSPVASMTTLPAEIHDAAGNLYATALLRFNTRDLLPFLGTFRPFF